MKEQVKENQIIKFLEEESDLALTDGLPETSLMFSEAAELIKRLMKIEKEIEQGVYSSCLD